MNRTFKLIRKEVLSSAGVLYNLGYILMAFVYAKSLKPLISAAGYPGEKGFYAPWLGVLIIAALSLETPAVFSKIKHTPFSRSKNHLILIVICLHFVMVSYAGYYAFRAFGFKGGWSSPLLLLFIAPLFIKEMAVMFAFVQAPTIVKKEKHSLKIFYNFSLFFSGLVLATVIWDTQLTIFGGLSDTAPGIVGDGTILLPGKHFLTVLICCMVMFIPTRMGFMFEESAVDEKIGKRVVFITILLAAVSGIAPYYLSS